LKITWKWLGDWVDLPDQPEELPRLLAMRGLPVQSLERGATFDPGIVVGSVLEVARHPGADRLSLCSVDIGSARLSIVCGAPNVAAGQRVAVAQVGSRLPDGTKLRKTKIRGVESEGMICSEKELGLSEESQGIWVLPGDPAVGAPLASVFGSADPVIDVEVTSNRTDCMCVVGLAREIASARGTTLKPAPPLKADGPGPLPEVTIESAADCPRYMARVVRGVKVGPSPDWLRRRLEAAGFRSISNVVDATNYVLHEFGQPIHAFDAAKVGGNAIRVRRAKAGERLTLLDGRDMALAPSHLVIADAKAPLALAGVMGGLPSGITDATTSVVLESAQFDPALTRETSRSLDIPSDAARRFGQGVDPEGVAAALDATARLLAEVAGGKVAKDRVDLWPGRAERPRVSLALGRLERLLGLPVDKDATVRALRSLGIEPAGAWRKVNGDEVAEFRIPSHRYDLEIEEDLIEEVGRVIGYDAIPGRLREVAASYQPERGLTELDDRIADLARGFGFHEALSNVLVGEIPPEARDGIADSEIWVIQNPKSRDLKHLRVGLLPGLIAAAGRNLHHGIREVRLAEIGKVFRAAPPPLGSERHEAALLLAGQPDEWDRPGVERDRYLELKGVVEGLLEALGIDSSRTDAYHEPCWRPGTGASIRASDRLLGRMGEVAAPLAQGLGLDRPAWAAVLDVAALAEAGSGRLGYRPIPRYPPSKRDLAVIVPAEATHADIVGAIRSAGGPDLVEVRLFDVFEGGPIGAGKKSMAYALEFRSSERTLSDREVDGSVDAIVRTLQSKFGAVLRGGAPASRPGSPTT
jgi:phenylalanyl-tRNA synthetase beta chain